MRVYQVVRIPVGIGPIINGVRPQDREIDCESKLASIVVVIGGYQAAGVFDADHLLALVVMPNGHLIQSVVIGQELVMGIEVIARNANAQRIRDRDNVYVVGGVLIRGRSDIDRPILLAVRGIPLRDQTPVVPKIPPELRGSVRQHARNQ